MATKKALFVFVVTLASTIMLFSQSKVGTTAAPFLGIAVGSRAIGLGGAFTAFSEDVSALYWNPAGFRGLGGMR